MEMAIPRWRLRPAVNRQIGLSRYAKPGWIVIGMLMLAAVLGPRLLGAAYLNLASIEITHGYATRNAATPDTFFAATNFAGLLDALRFTDSALALNRRDAAVWRQTGRALFLSGRPSQAEAALRRAAEADPRDVIARIALAQLHEATGRYSQAAAAWRELQAPAQLVTLGDRLLDQERWRAAIDAYRAAIEVRPDYVDAYYPLGWALYEHSGDWAGALSAFLTARELAPNSPWPYVSIGDLYMARHQTEKAIPWYQQALEVAPREPGLDTKLAWAYVAYGDKMLETGHWNRAETAYHAALEVLPIYVDAYHGLARLAWQGRSNLPVSIAILKRAIALAPTDFRSYVLMGDVVADEDPARAVEWYRRAESLLREVPVATADTHAQLGLVYARLGRYEAAIAELRTAIQMNPQNAWYHIGLGDVYRGMQDVERARREYSLAVELDPFNSHARKQLASLSGILPPR